jgi:hypothetical protein
LQNIDSLNNQEDVEKIIKKEILLWESLFSLNLCYIKQF